MINNNLNSKLNFGTGLNPKSTYDAGKAAQEYIQRIGRLLPEPKISNPIENLQQPVVDQFLGLPKAAKKRPVIKSLFEPAKAVQAYIEKIGRLLPQKQKAEKLVLNPEVRVNVLPAAKTFKPQEENPILKTTYNAGIGTQEYMNRIANLIKRQ